MGAEVALRVGAERKVIEERTERVTEARVRAEMLVGKDAIERRHARALIELSRIATLGSAKERSDALSDPIRQATIIKAVQTAADTNGES